MRMILFAVAFLIFGSNSYGQSVGDLQNSIVDLSTEIRNRVIREEYTPEQLTQARDSLRNILITLLAPAGSKLLCAKQSNGLFYPSTRQSGQIVGSTSYNAGYSTLDECKGNLPQPGFALACFKQGNSLFYPFNPESGAIVGSELYNAGHATPNECRTTLPRLNDSVVCFRQGNGLYYPTNPKTGAIIGSQSYNAGYSDWKDCKAAIVP